MRTIFILLLSISSFVVVEAQISKNVTLLDNWTNESLPRNNDNTIFNEVWGFEYQGREYAVIGSTAGTHIFLINENEKLIEVDFVPGESEHTVGSNNIHRDFKTYRNYLYGVCDEGNSTLQIMDLQYLPDSVSLVYNSDSILRRAHNIYIDTVNATMYGCGVTTNSFAIAMKVYSLANPKVPELIHLFNGATYVHDAFVRNDTAYLNCPFDGLQVYKFNQGTNPVLLGFLDIYPDFGYNHSGWLSEDGKHYVFADETTGKKMKICDVTNLFDIDIIDMFNSEGDNQTIAHNLMWKDDFIYVSHYYDGLQIFDARDKTNVKRVAWYDTFTLNSNPYQGAWGVYCFLKDNKVLLSDRSGGLYLFRVHLPPTISPELDFSVYPNPTSEEALFYFTNEVESLTYKLKIVDDRGRLVYTSENIVNNYLRLDVSKWASGTYFYHWEGMNSDISIKGKFVVIHP